MQFPFLAASSRIMISYVGFTLLVCCGSDLILFYYTSILRKIILFHAVYQAHLILITTSLFYSNRGIRIFVCRCPHFDAPVKKAVAANEKDDGCQLYYFCNVVGDPIMSAVLILD